MNYTPVQAAGFLHSVMKDGITSAFDECKQFKKYIKDKEVELEKAGKEALEKHTEHTSYIKDLLVGTDLAKFDKQLQISKDMIKLMELRKDLLTEEVTEHEKFFDIVMRAHAES